MRGVRSSLRLVLFVAAFATARDAAAGDCLPRALKAKDSKLRLDLGVVGGAPVACVYDESDAGQGATACWDVDVKKHALHARPAAPLPGHGYDLTTVNGCAAGFCGITKGTDPANVIVAPSTDGVHVAIAIGGENEDTPLQIFDATSKKRLRTVPIKIGNGLMKLAYVDDQVFIVGTDAGPFIGVWPHKDDGSASYALAADPHATGDEPDMLNVYLGGVSVLDDHRVALADTGFEHLAIVTAKDGGRVDLSRAVARGPCKKDAFESSQEGAHVSVACEKHLRHDADPYVDAPMIALADGTIVAALRASALGELAILDVATLSEKRRVHLPMCKK